MIYLIKIAPIFLYFVFFAAITLAADSDVDPTFVTGNSVGNPIAMVLQADGKIIVGGNFDSVGGVRRGKIARLNANGSLDTTFNQGNGVDGNGIVWSANVQPDGKVLIGGEFFSVNGTPRQYIARLNADGSLDSSFAPQLNAQVLSIVVQPDGKIIIAGDFSNVNGSFSARRLARLNADGSLDTSFSYSLGLDLYPAAICLQPDGKLFVGGNNRIVRLNSNGNLDGFNGGNAGVSGYVSSINCAAGDGSALIGGTFSAYNGTPRSNLIRIFADGSLDSNFNPQVTGSVAGGDVTTIRNLPDGKIIIAGYFNSVNGAARNGLARLNADGSLDNIFNPFVPFAGAVRKFLLQPDGKIIVGGQFGTIAGAARGGIARLNPDGTNDANFARKRGPNNTVFSLAPRADGKILIGGSFDTVEETPRRGIARLTSDGSLDTTFNPGSGVDGIVAKVAAQPDGKIIIAGFFTAFDGSPRRSIARLNADGSLDASFYAESVLEAAIADFEIQPDGKIIIAGLFGNVGGAAGRHVARLNADGSLDASFNPGAGADFEIYDVERQPNGMILVGGNFDNFNNSPRSSIARLNSNGSLDSSFNAGTQFDSAILSLVTTPDARIIVGGAFNSVNGTARNHVARLNADGSQDNSFVLGSGFTGDEVYKVVLEPDGKILVGGNFLSIGGVNRPRLARLMANGAVDTAFNVGGISGGANNQSEVDDIVVQANGKILFAGEFTVVNSLEANRISRLTGSFVAAAENTLYDFDGDGKSDVSVFRPANGAWYLQQSQNGFTGVQFGFTTDKIVPADYDGDGKTDLAVFRNGTWYLQRSQLGFTGVAFGAADDIPVPADYDGDGKADIAVFRPSNGTWYLLQSTAGFAEIAFGLTGDKPVPADYDADGKADIAVFRNGTWYIQRSQLGFLGIAFGESTDKPVVGDYDGDGKADVAVFRPSNGAWYLLRSQLGFTGITFGLGTDVPVPADYDGDSKTDVAVFRDGTWYLNRSMAGFTGVAFGAATDKPIPNAFVP